MDEAARDRLRDVIDGVIAPNAGKVDEGEFPVEAIEALGRAGILGLTVGPDAGGAGAGLRSAAAVVREIATVCGSTAMVALMHFAATAVIERHGSSEIRRAIAEGHHLTTLAFSETGSRSHFWAPLSTASPVDGGVRLDARKSWVTSAAHADSFVWSSRAVAADGPMTLWLVPASIANVSVAGPFDGFGLRGNGSVPVIAAGAELPRSAMLGADGAGLDIALADVLPTFLLLSAAFSTGLMDAVVEETGAHLRATRLEHLGQTLAEQPLPRIDHARMRLTADQAAALVADTLDALDTNRPDAMLRVLEVKAAAGEASALVTDTAMKVCGGAAFRKEVGIERRFRDARAARVMAPTTDALLDFVGRAINGLELL